MWVLADTDWFWLGTQGAVVNPRGPFQASSCLGRDFAFELVYANGVAELRICVLRDRWVWVWFKWVEPVNVQDAYGAA